MDLLWQTFWNYIHISNQYTIYLKLIKCYMSIICNKTRENIKTRRIKWSSNLTSGYISNGRKLESRRDLHPPMFTAVYYKIDKTQKRGSGCVCVTHGHTKEYYLAIKKETLSILTIWMELEDIMLSEISQRKANAIWYHLRGVYKSQNIETLRE